MKQKKARLKTQAIIPHINSEKNPPPTITNVVCNNQRQFCGTSFSVPTLVTLFNIVDWESPDLSMPKRPFLNLRK